MKPESPLRKGLLRAGLLLIHEFSVEAMKSGLPTSGFSNMEGDMDCSNMEGEAFLKSSNLETLQR